MKLTDIEEEVVFLKAIIEIIDSVINFEMLTLHGSDPDSSVLFGDITHQRFFNVVLVDFLCCTDKKAPVKQNSYLGALRAISANPSFSAEASVTELHNATCVFVDWLNQTVSVDVCLPSINTTTIQITRLSFLKMCGNISKHNILRSMGVVEELQQMLTASGSTVELEDAMLALDNFYERFHADILNYHSSTLAEFLNNIRWGIYEYLQPELRRSMVWEDGVPPKYRYIYPKKVVNNFAKQCYLELMNEISTPPYVRRFKVTKYLKLRY